MNHSAPIVNAGVSRGACDPGLGMAMPVGVATRDPAGFLNSSDGGLTTGARRARRGILSGSRCNSGRARNGSYNSEIAE